LSKVLRGVNVNCPMIKLSSPDLQSSFDRLVILLIRFCLFGFIKGCGRIKFCWKFRRFETFQKHLKFRVLFCFGGSFELLSV
jgi:hypothetical protein